MANGDDSGYGDFTSESQGGGYGGGAVPAYDWGSISGTGFDPAGPNPAGVSWDPAYGTTIDSSAGSVGGQPAFDPSSGGLSPWLYGGNTSDPSNPTKPGVSRPGGSMQGTTGESSVTTRAATKPMPTLGATPAYTAPTYDESKVTAYAQEEAGLGIAEWRQSLTSGLNKIMSEGNFATRADQMRKMFQGAGAGLANILKGATDEARNRYTVEYNAAVQQALIQHEDEVRQAYTQFQADMQNYFATFTQTTQAIGAGTSTALVGG